MKKVLSIIVLAIMSYIGIGLIFGAVSFLSNFNFSVSGFLFDNGIHIFWAIALLIFAWILSYMVALIIFTSQAISYSEKGTRYIVAGVVIILITIAPLIGNIITPENRSGETIATYIAMIIYGGMFIYQVIRKEHQ